VAPAAGAASGAATPAANPWRRTSAARSLTTLLVLLAIALGFYLAVYLKARWTADGGDPHLFVHPDNLANLLGQAAMVGILAAGMTLVIVSGQIDLSVGSLLGMLGAIAALLMSADRGPGWSTAAACAAALTLGAGLGAVHGWLVAYVGIPAFVVTLGGLLAYRGGLLLAARSTIPVRSAFVNELGCGVLSPAVAWQAFGVGLALLAASLLRRRTARRRAGLPGGALGPELAGVGGCGVAVAGLVAWLNRGQGVPARVLVMLVLAGLMQVVASRLRFGRHLYAIGGNREAAEYSGVRVGLHLVGVFALMGAIAATAGLVGIGMQMAADPGAGDLMELYAIAACVIGGTSLSGGRGSVSGSVLGALIMAVIRNGLSCLGVASAGEKIVLGVILVCAVGLDLTLARRRR
jgi:D-xylose transport system permease protein